MEHGYAAVELDAFVGVEDEAGWGLTPDFEPAGSSA